MYRPCTAEGLTNASNAAKVNLLTQVHDVLVNIVVLQPSTGATGSSLCSPPSMRQRCKPSSPEGVPPMVYFPRSVWKEVCYCNYGEDGGGCIETWQQVTPGVPQYFVGSRDMLIAWFGPEINGDTRSDKQKVRSQSSTRCS